MLDDQLLISELAERAGVSVRTIRFYISEGLLPAPQAHGRYSVYDEEYLTRIVLIKLLKNAYLPLKEIKRMVESLSKEEIESMLHRLSEPASISQVSSLAGPPAPAPAPRMPPDNAGASPSSARIKEGGLPEALDYIARVMKSQAAPASAAPQAAPAAGPLPSPVSQPARPLMRAMASLPEADAGETAGAAAAQPEEGASSWRRYTIHLGVELLVSEQVYNQSAPSIRRIVAQVKQLFSTHPSGGKNV
jgi:DNA-binding transcriptional MerR regulator